MSNNPAPIAPLAAKAYLNYLETTEKTLVQRLEAGLVKLEQSINHPSFEKWLAYWLKLLKEYEQNADKKKELSYVSRQI
jgi:hypothetical protein